MARALLPEDLWSLIAAHLPTHRPSPKGGRPRIDDRAALTGILFVLKTGIPWEYLPRELGCGSGMTCWRRLHEWMSRRLAAYTRGDSSTAPRARPDHVGSRLR
jgi:transposase